MFENLKKYDMQDEPVEFVLDMVEHQPVLLVLPATEANIPMLREVLRKSRSQQRLDITTPKSIDEGIERDKELYARYVLQGWRNVFDDEGNEAPFNRENALKYLQAMPKWMFLRLREFASNSSNFIEPEGGQLGN